ncbi:MAG: hypothetical protein QGI63_03735, partial [Rhodospirillales bacterium]|nr:hypothetical protein [Rhodospirillales bacterium]
WNTPSGKITMRADHQAVHGGMVGVTKYSEKYGFAVLEKMVRHKATDINPPLGMKTMDWVKSIK